VSREPRAPGTGPVPWWRRRRDLPRHADPGLQPERTAMAWTRTAVALAAVSLLFLRWVPQHGGAAAVLAAAGVLAAVALAWTQRRRHPRRSAAFAGDAVPADLPHAAALTGLVVVVALAGLVVVAL
jgi:uncharacterized membrane protein YidH (DUF202 family)